MARVLLAEPWFGGSHRAWAEGLARHSSHDISIVSLPPTLWRWRLRAGAAPLAEALAAEIARSGQPDVLLVSGLVDVAALLGHLRPRPALPVVVYMHESQLLYPTVSGAVDADATLRNWESWRAADAVWFNSAFHRHAVEAALPAWLAGQPEMIPDAVVDRVTARFDVVPVGVEAPVGVRPEPGPVPTIVWPHRWEPDKAPAVFGRALAKLVAAGLDFRLILAGDDPAESSDRSAIIETHRDRVMACGPFPGAEFQQLLHEADIVVSCADHEFFGIGTVEAMLAGCVPVLPNTLSYPDIVPEKFHDAVLYPSGSFGTRLVDIVGSLDEARRAISGLASSLEPLTWPEAITRYDIGLSAIVDSSASEL